MRIFIDLDGVVADLDLALGVQTGHIPSIDHDIYADKDILQAMSRGSFESFGGEQAWVKIKSRGYPFWSNIPKTKYADKLVQTCKMYGKVAFLTSPGNLKENAQNAGIAAHGKTIWVKKHFEQIPLIITRDKYLCANKDSILIDDLDRNLNWFTQNGGNVFKWPHQYVGQLNNQISAAQVFTNLKQYLQKTCK